MIANCFGYTSSRIFIISCVFAVFMSVMIGLSGQHITATTLAFVFFFWNV